MPLLTTGAGAYPAASGVGPPTFTFRSSGQGSVVSSTTAHVPAAAAGTPGATRFVAIMFSLINNQTVVSATFNATGTPVTANIAHIGADGSGVDQYIAYAIVAADIGGGGVTLDVVFTGTIFSGPIYFLYTADSSQLVSQTPVTAFNTTSTGTSLTTSINVLSGGAVLAIAESPAGSAPTFTTPNDPPVAQDAAFGTTLGGSKNNSAAFSPAQVSMSWTGTVTTSLSLATFR